MKAFQLVGEIKAILFECNIPLSGSNPQNFASTEYNMKFWNKKPKKLLEKAVETFNFSPQMSKL